MEYLDPQSTQPRLVGSRTPNTCWREGRPRLLEDKMLILPLALTFEGSLGEGAKGPAEEGDLEVSGGSGSGRGVEKRGCNEQTVAGRRRNHEQTHSLHLQAFTVQTAAAYLVPALSAQHKEEL